MKKNIFYFISIFIVSGLCISFTLPNSIHKKVSKEIKKVFEIDDFKLNPMIVLDSVNFKLQNRIEKEQLFKIEKEENLIGYAYINKAPSKTDEFDYLILLDKDLIIAKAKVLVYREDYGGEIGSKRWLKQFIGKNASDELKYEKDIIAISGATISANSMTIAINNFLKSLHILHENKVL